MKLIHDWKLKMLAGMMIGGKSLEVGAAHRSLTIFTVDFFDDVLPAASFGTFVPTCIARQPVAVLQAKHAQMDA